MAATWEQIEALENSIFDDNAPPQSILASEDLDVRRKTAARIREDIAVIPAGPQGAQGIQGPAGAQGAVGPVGPAGLDWKAAWVAATTYVADDAVGYGGASYFCILGITGNVSNTNPTVDTTHWALLAAQGAQGQPGATGAQGATGPQGAQGPAGAVAALTSGLSDSGTTASAYPVLQYDINDVDSSANNRGARLPNWDNSKIGQYCYVSCSYNLYVKAYDNGAKISIDTIFSNSNTINIPANFMAKFLYRGGGYWKFEVMIGRNLTFNGNDVRSNNMNIITQTVNNTAVELSLADLNTFYGSASYWAGYTVVCPVIGIEYLKTVSGWYKRTADFTVVT